MTLVRVLAMLALGGFLVTMQSGCLVAAAAGGAAGTVAYLSGDLEANLDAPVSRVFEASKQAMRDMDYVVVNTVNGSDKSEVVARTRDDNKVQIVIQPLTEKSSKISIRVGTFGDETLSTKILEKIRSHL